MRIRATFRYRGIGVEIVDLPMDQAAVKALFDNYGINYNEIEWRRSFAALQDELSISYEVLDRIAGDYYVYRQVEEAINDGEDFVIINLLAHVFEDMYGYDYDRISTYMEATDEGKGLSALINICLQRDDIYSYSSEYGYDTLEEAFAKLYYGEYFDSDYWDYVDFQAIGENYSDYICFGEDCWVDVNDPGDVSEDYYSFEDVCEKFDWYLTREDEIRAIEARAVYEMRRQAALESQPVIPEVVIPWYMKSAQIIDVDEVVDFLTGGECSGTLNTTAT